MLSGPPRLVPFLLAAFVLTLVVWYYHGVSAAGAGASLSPWKPGSAFSAERPSSLRPGVDPLDFSIPLRFSDGQPKPAGSNYTFKIVVPKTTKEDLEWMQQEIPHAPLVVYEVDNEHAENKVPKNKGREAMVGGNTTSNAQRPRTKSREQREEVIEQRAEIKTKRAESREKKEKSREIRA
jgi:Protein of unknown function (DUF3431)